MGHATIVITSINIIIINTIIRIINTIISIINTMPILHMDSLTNPCLAGSSTQARCGQCRSMLCNNRCLDCGDVPTSEADFA